MPDPISGTLGAIGIGGSLLSSGNNRRAVETATEAQTDASQQQINLARDIYNTQRDDNAPFRDAELQRTNAIGEIFGFNPVADNAPQPAQANPFSGGSGGVSFGGINFSQFGKGLQEPSRGNEYGPYGLNPLARNEGDYYNNRGQVDPSIIANGNGTYSPTTNGTIGAQTFTPGIASNEGVPTVGGGLSPAMERFNSSPFGEIFTNDFGLETDAIDAGLAGQGLNLSSVRTEAKEDARQRNFGNAFGNYFNALSGFPTSGAATQANNTAAQNYGNSAGQAYGNIGAAQAQGAYGQAQANNQLLNGIGGGIGTILGGF